jgi:hypothetical protein
MNWEVEACRQNKIRKISHTQNSSDSHRQAYSLFEPLETNHARFNNSLR